MPEGAMWDIKNGKLHWFDKSPFTGQFYWEEYNDGESYCNVIYDEENEQFVMLYRAAGNDVRHQIKLGLATSKDGIHFVRQSDKPAFEGSHEEPDGGCVEDPRLMKSPVVRNGKQVTVGYCPDIWSAWE